MKLVLDTNVYVSAFLWNGLPRKILQRCIDLHDELYVSYEILKELEQVLLRPKFKLSAISVQYLVNEIMQTATIVPLFNTVQNICRDADDHKILECAVRASVDCIITGDEDLLTVKRFRNIPIYSPKDFDSLYAI